MKNLLERVVKEKPETLETLLIDAYCPQMFFENARCACRDENGNYIIDDKSRIERCNECWSQKIEGIHNETK